MALRLLRLRGFACSFSVSTSLEVVGRLLGPCLGLVAVSLGAGPFPNHGNVLMHLHRTFPVLTALSFSRRPISVSPSLCLSVSPLPSPRLPLVGACSRRCGSRRFPASAVVVFAVSCSLRVHDSHGVEVFVVARVSAQHVLSWRSLGCSGACLGAWVCLGAVPLGVGSFPKSWERADVVIFI